MIKYIETSTSAGRRLVIEIEAGESTAGLEDLGASAADLASAQAQVEDLGAGDYNHSAVRNITVHAPQAFNEMLEMVQSVAKGFHECMRSIEPTEGSVEFGLSIKSEAGIVVARASGEASFKVVLTWHAQKQASDGH